MSPIRQAQLPADTAAIQHIFWEYLSWANDRNAEVFGIQLDITAMLADDMQTLDKFMPPTGRLLLAHDGEQVQGCLCLKALTPPIAEVKRLYVRPAYRGQGIATALLTDLLHEARASSYITLRRDSANYMHAAHALYHKAGFRPRPPYAESEVPAAYHPMWVFMEYTFDGM